MRAVNIEDLPKLDTDSFVNTITRFIARRGKRNTIISDNGTNFAAAERELGVRCGMEQRMDRRTSNLTRNQMDVQPTRSTSL